jgi:cell division transport system permease protein
LERDKSTKYLPWIIAPMVFLAVMSLAAVQLVGGIVASWDAQVTGSMTVQVMFRGDENRHERVEDALAFITATPGVADATAMELDAARALLEPWLGDIGSALPVPDIIEVTLRPGATLDVEIFAARLAAIVPDVHVDDHRVWLDDLVGLADAIMAAAIGTLVLVAFSAASTIVYATLSGLAVHRQTIDLLHHIGAYDRYIARQFQRHFVRIGARGGFWGSVLAAICLAGLFYFGRNIDGAFLPPLALDPVEWAFLALIPVATIFLAAMTARVTVMRALARLQ